MGDVAPSEPAGPSRALSLACCALFALAALGGAARAIVATQALARPDDAFFEDEVRDAQAEAVEKAGLEEGGAAREQVEVKARSDAERKREKLVARARGAEGAKRTGGALLVVLGALLGVAYALPGAARFARPLGVAAPFLVMVAGLGAKNAPLEWAGIVALGALSCVAALEWAAASPWPHAPARAPRGFGALLALDQGLQRVEVAVCAVSLLVMIALTFTQVLLRKFRTETFVPVGWFDVLARYMVLWVGMLGASLCTAEGRHITVEVVPKLLGPVGRRRLDVIVSAAALGVIGVLFALSMVYLLLVAVPDWRVDNNHLFSIESLGQLSVPRWPFLVIMPLGLLAIGWRFALRSALALFMSDAEYKEREEAAEREVVSDPHEADEAALLLEAEQETARESGREPTLTPEAAREEVRKALHSDRAPTSTPAPTTAAAPGAPASPAKAGAPASPAKAGAPRPGDLPREGVPGRSTDEIPIYRDIADDDDLTEPAGRHAGAAAESSDALEPPRPRAAVDSSDVLEPPSDLGDVDDAVERLADTERLRATGAPPAEEEVTETDRLPRPELPGLPGEGERPA